MSTGQALPVCQPALRSLPPLIPDTSARHQANASAYVVGMSGAGRQGHLGTKSDVSPYQMAESAASRGPARRACLGYNTAHGCQPEWHRVQTGQDSCAAPVRAAAIGHAAPSSQRAAPLPQDKVVVPEQPSWSPSSAMTLLLCLMGGNFRLLHYGLSMLGGAESHEEAEEWSAGEMICSPCVMVVCPALSTSYHAAVRATTAVNDVAAAFAETLALSLADNTSKKWTEDLSRVLKLLSQCMAEQQWVRRIAAASHPEKVGGNHTGDVQSWMDPVILCAYGSFEKHHSTLTIGDPAI